MGIRNVIDAALVCDVIQTLRSQTKQCLQRKFFLSKHITAIQYRWLIHMQD